MSQSRVTWATCVPNLVLLGLSVLDLCPMYVTDRRQTVSSLNAPPRGGGIIIIPFEQYNSVDTPLNAYLTLCPFEFLALRNRE